MHVNCMQNFCILVTMQSFHSVYCMYVCPGAQVFVESDDSDFESPKPKRGKLVERADALLKELKVLYYVNYSHHYSLYTYFLCC